MNSMKRYKKIVLHPVEWILALSLIPLLLVTCAVISVVTTIALGLAVISLIGLKVTKQDTKTQYFQREL